MFLMARNYLRPFSEALDRPLGQEWGRGAVRGQEGLHEVKF